MSRSAGAGRSCVVAALVTVTIGIVAAAGVPRAAGADPFGPVSRVGAAGYVIGAYFGFEVGFAGNGPGLDDTAKDSASVLAHRQGVLRAAAEPQSWVPCSACGESADTPWRTLVEDMAGAHPLRQLDAVNRFFNRIAYGEDSDVYGVNDYWAPPQEFLRRTAGDCEDYSIAKYAALRAMGWSADALLVVAIRDRKHNVDHAVLAARLNGQWYYLDNRSSRLLKPRQVPFYQPVYALNERRHSVFIKSGTSRLASAWDKERSNGGEDAG